MEQEDGECEYDGALSRDPCECRDVESIEVVVC